MNGLFDSVRRLLAGLVAIAQTRLELVTTELAAEIQRAVGLLLWAAVALFFAGLSVLMIAITLVVFAPESRRLLVAGLVCAAFVAGAIGAGLVVRHRLAARSPLLAASLGELRKDREALERGLASAAANSGATSAASSGVTSASTSGSGSAPRSAAATWPTAPPGSEAAPRPAPQPTSSSAATATVGTPSTAPRREPPLDYPVDP